MPLKEAIVFDRLCDALAEARVMPVGEIGSYLSDCANSVPSGHPQLMVWFAHEVVSVLKENVAAIERRVEEAYPDEVSAGGT